MESRPITRRIKLGGAVLAATEINTGDVTAALLAELQPVLEEGATPPDLGEIQQVLARFLGLRLDELVTAHEANEAELLADRRLRRRRDRAAKVLYDALVSLRQTLEGIYGPEGADVVGIDGRTAEDPVVLYQQGTRAVERLRGEGQPLPEAKLASLAPDPVEVADDVVPALQALGEILDQARREARETQKAQTARNRALAAYDTALRPVARILEGFYELAGFPELAERVRPATARRPTATPDGEESTEAPAPPEPEGEELPEVTGSP